MYVDEPNLFYTLILSFNIPKKLSDQNGLRLCQQTSFSVQETEGMRNASTPKFLTNLKKKENILVNILVLAFGSNIYTKH